MSNNSSNWIIEYATVRHAESDSFEIPSSKSIDELETGNFAKLIFTNTVDGKPQDSERMWVIIKNIGKTFKGKLDNDPMVITQLKAGDEIEFSRNNIIDVMTD